MTSTFPDDAQTLSSGGRMPVLGFGTWQLKGGDAFDAVTTALDVGYRHLDTATLYANEGEIGSALEKSAVQRDEVFLTTKIPGDRGGEEEVTLRESLRLLGTDHVDLWLIHWPVDGGANVAMWRALIQAGEAGHTKAIGVSNYSLDQIDELVEATGVTPAVNQIEWSPLLFDKALLEGHRERGVVVEGYSGLRGGTLDHPVIREVAERHDTSPAQVIVRWHLQHRVVVIPKSAHPDRIRSNAEVSSVQLADDDMAHLDALGKS